MLCLWVKLQNASEQRADSPSMTSSWGGPAQSIHVWEKASRKASCDVWYTRCASWKLVAISTTWKNVCFLPCLVDQATKSHPTHWLNSVTPGMAAGRGIRGFSSSWQVLHRKSSMASKIYFWHNCRSFGSMGSFSVSNFDRLIRPSSFWLSMGLLSRCWFWSVFTGLPKMVTSNLAGWVFSIRLLPFSTSQFSQSLMTVALVTRCIPIEALCGASWGAKRMGGLRHLSAPLHNSMTLIRWLLKKPWTLSKKGPCSMMVAPTLGIINVRFLSRRWAHTDIRSGRLRFKGSWSMLLHFQSAAFGFPIIFFRKIFNDTHA